MRISPRLLRILFFFQVAVVLLLSVSLAIPDGWPWYEDNDFAHYYMTAQLFREGRGVYRAELPALVTEYGFAPTVEIERPTNPPALVMVTLPLAFFSPKTAFWIWTAVQILSLAASILVTLRLIGLRTTGIESVFLFFSAVAMQASLTHLRYAQSQFLILFLLVSGLAMVLKQRNAWGSFLWGLASSLKLFTLPLVFVLWRYRGASAVGWFAAGFVFLYLAAFLFIGIQDFLDFAEISLRYVQVAAVQYSANVGALGTIANTVRLLDVPWIGMDQVVRIGTITSLVGLSLVLYLELKEELTDDRLPLSTAICVVACMFFAVTCWTHYLVLTVFPLLLVLSRYQHRPPAFLLVLMLDYQLLGSTTGRLGGVSDAMGYLTTGWPVGAVALLYYLLLIAGKDLGGSR